MSSAAGLPADARNPRAKPPFGDCDHLRHRWNETFRVGCRQTPRAITLAYETVRDPPLRAPGSSPGLLGAKMSPNECFARRSPLRFSLEPGIGFGSRAAPLEPRPFRNRKKKQRLEDCRPRAAAPFTSHLIDQAPGDLSSSLQFGFCVDDALEPGPPIRRFPFFRTSADDRRNWLVAPDGFHSRNWRTSNPSTEARVVPEVGPVVRPEASRGEGLFVTEWMPFRRPLPQHLFSRTCNTRLQPLYCSLEWSRPLLHVGVLGGCRKLGRPFHLIPQSALVDLHDETFSHRRPTRARAAPVRRELRGHRGWETPRGTRSKSRFSTSRDHTATGGGKRRAPSFRCGVFPPSSKPVAVAKLATIGRRGSPMSSSPGIFVVKTGRPFKAPHCDVRLYAAAHMRSLRAGSRQSCSSPAAAETHDPVRPPGRITSRASGGNPSVDLLIHDFDALAKYLTARGEIVECYAVRLAVPPEVRPGFERPYDITRRRRLHASVPADGALADFSLRDTPRSRLLMTSPGSSNSGTADSVCRGVRCRGVRSASVGAENANAPGRYAD